jgi:hypothetical protein
MPVHPAHDTAAADWLVERVTTFAESVLSLVPGGFAAYVRIRHPYALGAPPRAGTLAPEAARAVASILARHTSTPGRCWFAVWDGWGAGYAFDRAAAATFALPNRRYHLASGPAAAAGTSVLLPPWTQSASLWWADDRAWCVATEVDLYSSFVGCDERAADELTACGLYRVDRVAPTTGITWADDPYGT